MLQTRRQLLEITAVGGGATAEHGHR